MYRTAHNKVRYTTYYDTSEMASIASRRASSTRHLTRARSSLKASSARRNVCCLNRCASRWLTTGGDGSKQASTHVRSFIARKEGKEGRIGGGDITDDTEWQK